MSSVSDVTSFHPDYIVVGGGTSGLVVASRLTEDPATKVLVLEAGASFLNDPRVNTPAFWTSLIDGDMDWAFAAVPQNGLDGRVQKLPQGKGLGGSSALNGQAFVGPSQASLDAWELLGSPGWNWKSLSPYFRKMHTLHLPDAETQRCLGLSWVDKASNGTSGPIQASFAGTATNSLNKAWVDTFAHLKYTTNADPFSGNSIGGYSNASSIDPRTKTRSYAANEYAAPAMSRPNLKIVTRAIVQKITFERHDSGVVATGAIVLLDGSEQQVPLKAAKEIILAAGVFSTPKLLELSGVGSQAILEQHGIPVVVRNDSVGENLQDHLLTGISYEVVDGINTIDPLMRREPQAMKAAQELYKQQQDGPFCTGGVTSHAYMPIMDFHGPEGKSKRDEVIKTFLDPQPTPDARLIADMIASGEEATGALFLLQGQGVSHENEATSDRPATYQEGSFLSIGPTQTHPMSRGTTHIVSADPSAKPRIDHRYFSHPLDLEIMARHLLDCERIRAAPPLAAVLKPNGRRNHARAHIKTLADAKQYLAETARTAHHSCGTCAMKPLESGGVVDANLKVYGTANLRIVDASIFPLISRGNTMSTVYAVAERAADIIKAGAA